MESVLRFIDEVFVTNQKLFEDGLKENPLLFNCRYEGENPSHESIGWGLFYVTVPIESFKKLDKNFVEKMSWYYDNYADERIFHPAEWKFLYLPFGPRLSWQTVFTDNNKTITFNFNACPPFKCGISNEIGKVIVEKKSTLNM